MLTGSTTLSPPTIQIKRKVILSHSLYRVMYLYCVRKATSASQEGQGIVLTVGDWVCLTDGGMFVPKIHYEFLDARYSRHKFVILAKIVDFMEEDELVVVDIESMKLKEDAILPPPPPLHVSACVSMDGGSVV